MDAVNDGEGRERCGRRRSGSYSRVHFGISSSSACYFVPMLVMSVACSLLSSVQVAEARYPEQFLESVEVCAAGSYGFLSALALKKIRLQNFPNNTVSVKLTRWEDLYASFYNYRCKFKVTAPRNMGVMVVIQEMNMRSTKQATCRDFIQFKNDAGIKTSQICGNVEATDTAKIPETIIGPRKFYDPKGEMEVTFFTDARDANAEHEDPISLHLVFTAYRECIPALVNSNVIRQCSSLRSHSCISSHLFCDGVINCGFNDDDGFGNDEEQCGDIKSRDMDEVDRTISIYVFAITTVATLVIVVIFSLIVCCCLRKFAKQRRDHHQVYAQAANSSLHHMHHVHSQHSSMGPDVIRLDTTGPSAPIHAAAQPSPEKYPMVDMDQPPPYDALFPSSKPTTTKPSKKQ